MFSTLSVQSPMLKDWAVGYSFVLAFQGLCVSTLCVFPTISVFFTCLRTVCCLGLAFQVSLRLLHAVSLCFSVFACLRTFLLGW
jgi:hypothetical protein